MNREIKFRVWLPESKIMMRPKGIIEIQESAISGVTIGQMKKWVWLQFTGLKEHCNDDTSLNKEIYEGDIVEFINGARAAVEWNDDTRQWQFSDGSPLNDGERYATHKQIVGNVFEHPHLLTNQNKG